MRYQRPSFPVIFSWVMGILLIIIGIMLLTLPAKSAQEQSHPPVLPVAQVKVRKPLPALKLLLRDGHTVVTVKENLKGVQIDITELKGEN